MLQTVRAMFGARKLSAAEAYRKLVDDTANGKPIPADAVDTCIAAGKSVADFEGDVSLLSARKDAAADLAKVATMTKDIERLTEAYTAAAKARSELEERHRREMDAAQAKFLEAMRERSLQTNQRDSLRDRAMKTLIGTADPAISQAIAALNAERERLRNESNESMQRSKFIVSAAWDRKTIEARRTEHDQKNTEWLAGIAQRETEILAEIAELEAKRLDPAACAIG